MASALEALQGFAVPTYIWPIGTQSSPFWCSTIIVLLTIFVKSFLFKESHKGEEKHNLKRKDYILRVMAAIFEYVEKKDADHAKSASTSKNGEDFGPDGMPEAHRVFSLIWDDAHECPTTVYGIDPSDERMVKAQALLKRLAATELRKASAYTTQAIQIAHGGSEVPPNLEKVMAYWSGDKLRAAIDFHEKTLKEHLGPGYVDEELLKEAEKAYKDVQVVQGKNMAKLWAIVMPHMPVLCIAWALMIVRNVIAAQYHAIGSWMEPIEFALKGDYDAMAGKFFSIFLAHVIIDAVGTVYTAFVGRATAELTSSVTQEVLQCLLQQDYEFFDRTPSGIVQERLNRDANAVGNNIVEVPEKILRLLTRMIASLVIVYFSCPQDLFWISLLPMIPTYFLQKVLRKRQHLLGNRERKLEEISAASTGETLREIKTVRQFAMESAEADKFRFNSTRRQALFEEIDTSHKVVGMIFGVTAYGGLILTNWLGAYRVVSGEMSFAAITDMTFKLNGDVMHCLREIMEELPKVNKLMQPLVRISELLESNPKIEPALGNEVGLKPKKFTGLIEFDNVKFAYPKDPRKSVLKGLTFTVEPGQKVALIGATGCGKSSTMSLLQRLYDPSEGTIRIDGKPLKSFDIRYLRQRIVIVDQFTVLFACSIRDNITYGMEGVSDEEIEKACKDAACWDFIQEKPDKFMTMVSPGGSNFSGGQRQRIAIARAIVRKPDVILLDEATASLDNENEALVQQALDKLARKGSALVIAHRLSTVKDSDKIVVIDQGVKVEEGDHETLLGKSPAEDGKAGTPLSPTTRGLSEDSPLGAVPPKVGSPLRCASENAPMEASPSLRLSRQNTNMEPNMPPKKLSFSRWSSFHGVQVAPTEKGVTYRKLWDASNATSDKMTVFQMQTKIDKLEAESAGLKQRVANIRAHTANLTALGANGGAGPRAVDSMRQVSYTANEDDYSSGAPSFPSLSRAVSGVE